MEHLHPIPPLEASGAFREEKVERLSMGIEDTKETRASRLHRLDSTVATFTDSKPGLRQIGSQYERKSEHKLPSLT